MARWGLIPFWMKEKPQVPHINARAETVDRLPLFREAFGGEQPGGKRESWELVGISVSRSSGR
jgi:hypothetical protein